MIIKPEFISLTSSDELDLPGLFFEPIETTSKTKRAVVFLHGCGSSSVFYKPKKINLFARELINIGYSFLAFNNRGAHYLKKFSRGVGEEKVEVMKGTATEIIAETVLDINSAIAFLHSRGYEEVVLLGESTGANKICVYQHYEPKNQVAGHILVGGGDDTGLWWHLLEERAEELFSEAKKRVLAYQNDPTDENKELQEELISTRLSHWIMSYQGLYDVMNPDGDYNTFPFREHTTDWKPSTKPLFRYFKDILQPSLVLYGEQDEYTGCPPIEAAKILKKIHPNPTLITTQVVAGSDHSFKNTEEKEIKAVVSWLQKTFLSS